MRSLVRSATVAAALAAAFTVPAAAQQSGLVGDLLRDVTEVEGKLLALARETPAEKYDWRPAEGVRSVGEVYLHLAADNYLLPIALGVAAPAETGIKGDDYNTVMAYETRALGRDAIIAELERSLAHFKQALTDTPAARLDETITMFGQSFTVQQLCILGTTHLHEHLGQAIAYARSNGIVPPWSRSGT
jgi:uncharacterized damage-inducible protein DinB